MIFVIDDDEMMRECVVRACGDFSVREFSNAIAAMNALDEGLPDLIFLDIMLDGPDGFTFLNELISYTDTAKIPVVIITSLDFNADLKDYGVVEILHKETMTPGEVREIARKYGK